MLIVPIALWQAQQRHPFLLVLSPQNLASLSPCVCLCFSPQTMVWTSHETQFQIFPTAVVILDGSGSDLLGDPCVCFHFESRDWQSFDPCKLFLSRSTVDFRWLLTPAFAEENVYFAGLRTGLAFWECRSKEIETEASVDLLPSKAAPADTVVRVVPRSLGFGCETELLSEGF